MNKGKWFLERKVLSALLPKQGNFNYILPNGCSVELYYSESLGSRCLAYGRFEIAEIEYIQNNFRGVGLAIDVGANVGMYTLTLSNVVGDHGNVWAFEALPQNVSRLKSNIYNNNLNNVEVFPLALGDDSGSVDFLVATDGAYGSLISVQDNKETNQTIKVQVEKLDVVWGNSKKPKVDFIKIDVEGAEVGVLKGAINLLQTCKPVILIEANSNTHLNEIESVLQPIGYRWEQPKGFEKQNYIFSHKN
ncbi:MAG: FkbM family methyltransferase [Bacteroidales bacterium]|nr:FkbM family methyltransferase [Bacteroidales bacterium]